jgi:hypothetical protein
VPAKPYIRLPSSRGWILRQYPGTGMQAAWLGALFAAPGTAEFLAAAPQAGRLLRPLCRMRLAPGKTIPFNVKSWWMSDATLEFIEAA